MHRSTLAGLAKVVLEHESVLYRRAHLRDFVSPRQSRQDKIRAGSRIVKHVIYKEYFGSFHL